MSKIRVLLTGAGTGVGREIFAQLLNMLDSFELSVFDIKRGSTMSIFEKNRSRIHVFYGDLQNIEDSKEACRNQDFVIHAHALPKANSEKRLRLAEDANVMATRYLIENLERLSPGCFISYLSTAAVYGDRLKAPMISVENMTCPSMGDYDALTRLQAEKLIMESTLEWTILRSGFIMGPDATQLGGLFFNIPLATRFEAVHQDDLSKALINTYRHRSKLWGRVFNVGGGESCRSTYKDYVKQVFQIFGFGPMQFAEKTFAARNAWGGYFADSDQLEEILQFRQISLEDYYAQLRSEQPMIKKISSKLFGGMQKKNLITKSEPLRAFKTNDKSKIKYYF